MSLSLFKADQVEWKRICGGSPLIDTEITTGGRAEQKIGSDWSVFGLVTFGRKMAIIFIEITGEEYFG